MFRPLSLVLLTALTIASIPAVAQNPPQNPTTPAAPAARPARTPPPTRDPNTPGYVTAKDLPDGANAPAKTDGNFILGPTHNPAPEMAGPEGVLQGATFELAMRSSDSQIYP